MTTNDATQKSLLTWKSAYISNGDRDRETPTKRSFFAFPPIPSHIEIISLFTHSFSSTITFTSTFCFHHTHLPISSYPCPRIFYCNFFVAIHFLWKKKKIKLDMKIIKWTLINRMLCAKSSALAKWVDVFVMRCVRVCLCVFKFAISLLHTFKSNFRILNRISISTIKPSSAALIRHCVACRRVLLHLWIPHFSCAVKLEKPDGVRNFTR